MFAKVFGQIFDSSIAEDYNCRRMFVDLLILADSDGVVDMTPEAISRRTNVPMDQVEKYIKELQQPDPLSRSKLEQGRRIIPIDPERTWGWQIVNYRHYRNIRDEEARRSYFRAAKRKQRERVKKKVKDKLVDIGGHGGQVLTPASASSSVPVPVPVPVPKPAPVLGDVPASLRSDEFNQAWKEWQQHRREIKKPLTPTSSRQQLAELQLLGQKRAIIAIRFTIAKGWQGLREPDPPQVQRSPSFYSGREREKRRSYLQEEKNKMWRMKQDENREFTEEENDQYRQLARELEALR